MPTETAQKTAEEMKNQMYWSFVIAAVLNAQEGVNVTTDEGRTAVSDKATESLMKLVKGGVVKNRKGSRKLK